MTNPSTSNESAFDAVKQLGRGARWTFLGAAASRLAILLTSLLTARLLGHVAFGELGVIENSVGMLAVFANLGLSLTSTKFVAKYRRIAPQRAGRVLGLCCIFAAISATAVSAALFVASHWIASVSLAAPHLAGPLRLAAAIVVLSAINGALGGALIGLQAFRQVAAVNVLTGFITAPLVVGGAAIGGLRGAVSGLVLAQLVSAAVHVLVVRQTTREYGIDVTWRGCWQERGVLLSFSLPSLINSSLRSPVNWLCAAMLVNQEGGYAEMGRLHAVNPWFLLLMFLPGQLANVYYPMFEDALARGDRLELRRLVWKSTQVNVAVCLALAVVIALIAEPIMATYGPAYREGAWVLRASALTGLVIAAQQPLSAYLVAEANMWAVTAISAVWAAVFLGASFGLLEYGALGVAAARLAAYAAYGSIVVAIAWPRLKAAADGSVGGRPTRPVARFEPSIAA